MLNNLIFKFIPHLFVLFFLFLEFTPDYVFKKELIKPYMFFIILYCWISNDFRKFSPISILILCTLYDLLADGVVGITCLFFLFAQYNYRKRFNDLISNDFKETWVRFIFIFTSYLCVLLLINIFLTNYEISFRKITISFISSIALFPLFYSIVNKLSLKFKS